MKIAISPPNERLSPGGKMLAVIRVSEIFLGDSCANIIKASDPDNRGRKKNE